jgi:predicted transcriptional regulator
MRFTITVPPEVEERVRTIADAEHRDMRRQIEKIFIDAVRQYPDVDSIEAASKKEAVTRAS